MGALGAGRLAPLEIREMHADGAPPTVRRTCEHLSFIRLLFSSALSFLPLSPPSALALGDLAIPSLVSIATSS